VYFESEDKWMVKCKDGKFREVINDGKLHSGTKPLEPGSKYLYTEEGYEVYSSASREKERRTEGLS